MKFGATDSNPGGPFAYTFAVASVPSHGTLGPVEGDTILYTPTHDYSGPDVFTYTVTDVNGVSVPATVTITVLPPGAAVDGDSGDSNAQHAWACSRSAVRLGLLCSWHILPIVNTHSCHRIASSIRRFRQRTSSR